MQVTMDLANLQVLFQFLRSRGWKILVSRLPISDGDRPDGLDVVDFGEIDCAAFAPVVFTFPHPIDVHDSFYGAILCTYGDPCTIRLVGVADYYYSFQIVLVS